MDPSYRFWRDVMVWHRFFQAWRPWSIEGSHDRMTWTPITAAECTGERIAARRRTDIVDS